VERVHTHINCEHIGYNLQMWQKF